MKAVVAAFNQEKAFSVIMYLRMEIFEALVSIQSVCRCTGDYCNVYPPEGSVGNSAGGMLVTTLLLLPTALMLDLTI